MYKINISYSERRITNLGLGLHIKRCITQALRFQKVNVPCEINVFITDNPGIRAINAVSRNIDRETDVLSFPCFEFQPGVLPETWDEYIDPDTNRVPLGDMCISLEKALEQGFEFGHGLKREVGYLVVHSVLHLLGYDHLDEGEMKRQMRSREDEIMARLMLPR